MTDEQNTVSNLTPVASRDGEIFDSFMEEKEFRRLGVKHWSKLNSTLILSQHCLRVSHDLRTGEVNITEIWPAGEESSTGQEEMKRLGREDGEEEGKRGREKQSRTDESQKDAHHYYWIHSALHSSLHSDLSLLHPAASLSLFNRQVIISYQTRPQAKEKLWRGIKHLNKFLFDFDSQIFKDALKRALLQVYI